MHEVTFQQLKESKFHSPIITDVIFDQEKVIEIITDWVNIADKGFDTLWDANMFNFLWKYGKEPIEVMPKLVEYCDVVMGNIWSANKMLGISVDEHIHENKSREKYLAHAKRTSLEIIERFPKCEVVANTFRFDSESDDVLYYTSLFTNGQQYNSAEFTCKGVVDRSGSGDCFMAGLIYGLYKKMEPQEIVDYATAAAFGKLQEHGDATGQDVLTVSENKKINTENAIK